MIGLVVARLRELGLWVGAALGLLAIIAGIAVTFFGFTFLVFRSGSMGPAIPTGSLAVARTVPAHELRRGDVVSVVSTDGTRITHRVVDAVPVAGRTALVLKGDANGSPDSEVYTATVADRVWFSVPDAGYALAAATTPATAVVAGCLVVVLLLRAPRPGHPVGRWRGRPGATLPIAIIACVGLGLPVARGLDSTLAAFTDSPTVTSGVNSAGTADLTLNGQLAGSAGAGGTTTFTALQVTPASVGLAPGESVAAAFPVADNGTLQLAYTVAATATGALAPAVLYTVSVGSSATASNTGTQAAATRSGSCTGTVLVSNQTFGSTAVSVAGARTLPAGGSENFCVVARLDPNAASSAQSQLTVVSLTFSATAGGSP